MDYSNYNVKEKAQIAAIILATAEKIKAFQSLGLGNRPFDQHIGLIMLEKYNNNFMPVVKAELQKLNLPQQIIDNATLSPSIWKSMSNQGAIIERLKKVFITDLENNEDTKLYASSSRVAFLNVFNIRLQ